MLKTLVVNRDGKAVMHWPSLMKTVLVFGLVTLLFSVFVSKSFAMSFAAVAGITVAVGILRSLFVAPASLPRAGSHVA
jgi:ABC-type multidrug transport system permease subunit